MYWCRFSSLSAASRKLPRPKSNPQLMNSQELSVGHGPWLARLTSASRPRDSRKGLVSKSDLHAVRPGIALYPFAALPLIWALTACAPGFQPLQPQVTPQSPQLTGGKTDDGRAHTGISEDHELSQVQQSLDPQSEPTRQLSRSILTARLDRRDDEKLRLVVALRAEGRLQFEFTDSGRNADRRLQPARESNSRPFEAALQCRDADCLVAVVSLRRTDATGAPAPQARAGLVLRKARYQLVARSPEAANIRDLRLKAVLEKFRTPQDQIVQSFEVAYGASGFELDLGTQDLCLAGRLVETNEADEPLRLHCQGSMEPRDLIGRMIGNTTRGEFFFELAFQQRFGLVDHREAAYLYLRRDRPTSPPPAAPVAPGTTPAPGASPRPGATPVAGAPASPTPTAFAEQDDEPEMDLFADPVASPSPRPSPGTRPSTPATPRPGGNGWMFPVDLDHEVTKKFSSDRRNSTIDAGVKVSVDPQSPDGRRLMNFGHRFRANAAKVLPALQAQGVPNEFAFITLIESRFFTADGYPVEVSGVGAVGPWQFMPRTATWSLLGLNIRPLVVTRNERGQEVRTADPCDERGDLDKSSVAAAKYFKFLLNMFPRDPKLALMSYNWGQDRVGNAIGCLQNQECMRRRLTNEGNLGQRLDEIRSIGLNYWAVRRFNMAPQESIQYVEKFLVAHHAHLEMRAPTPVAHEPWKPTTCPAR